VSTKLLYVLRHAKSSWDDPGLHDPERPLAPRGLRAAKLLGGYVRDNGIAPAQVLCSPARRTLQTLEGVAPGGELLIEPTIYFGGPAEIVERLRQIPAEIESAMVIGHNPALQKLVLLLAGGNGGLPAGSHLAEVRNKFPTGALATLKFDCAWRELSPGSAQLTDYVRPKSLG
jgi:phosphohistidine phosphatase